MFIVALAVGLGLFAFDVYELANRPSRSFHR